MTSEAREVMGREVHLPLQVREAEALFACYLVRAVDAHRLLSDAGLEEAHLTPGTTLCAIVALQYIDGDLGPYQEVAIVFFVRRLDTPARGHSFDWIDFLRRRVSTYVYQLPVTEVFAMEAGTRIWGFPKWMGAISLQFDQRAGHCALHSGGSHVLSLTVQCRLGSSFRDQDVVTYTRKNGALYRVPWMAGGKRCGLRLGGAALTLGDHPIGESLRSLGLPKRALVSGRASGVHAAFHPPERCG